MDIEPAKAEAFWTACPCKLERRGRAGGLRRPAGAGRPSPPSRDEARELWGAIAASAHGPDEWLIQAPAARETSLVQGLSRAPEGQHAAVTVLSGGQTVIGLRGAEAALVLAKGCTLDLHPRTLTAEDCAQARLAKANVLLHRLAEGDGFEITVRRSFTDYPWRWLVDAGAEHGLEVIAPSPEARGLAA